MHLVGAVDGEVDGSMGAEGGEGDAKRLGLRGRAFGCRDADDAQSLPHSAAKRVDHEGGGGAGAEAEHHAVLDGAERGLRGLALEVIRAHAGTSREVRASMMASTT